MRHLSFAFLLLAACGDDEATHDAAPVPVDAAAPSADAGPDVPGTPAGARLVWVLASLNGAPFTNADVSASFTADFLAQVPVAQVRAVFEQLAAFAPWTFVDVEREAAASLTAVVRRADGQYWRIDLSVDAAEGDRMNGLALAPAGDLDPALASFAAVDEAMQELAPRVNLLAARVETDGCTPLHALHPEASLAIGSAFKLYVLAALADRIEAGQLAWSDTVAVRDEWKSLSEGPLQDAPVGTLVPVRSYAEQMIWVSDNTATDHLLFTVGRDAVEATLAGTGHHAPAENQPFLSTRELFTLKLLLTAEERTAYLAAPVAERRTLLEGYAGRDPRSFTGGWVLPRDIDTLEWFATPGDLCQVMRTLRDQGERPATQPVLEVLSINPGLLDPRGLFSYIGFKGGSEPGVLELTWLVRRASDGEWRFLSLAFNDPVQPLAEDRIVYVATAARALLSK